MKHASKRISKQRTTTSANSKSYCMELRTVQSGALKILIEALKKLLIDTTIDFDETGIKKMATDTRHVVLVLLSLDANKFEYYDCPKKLSIGVNMLNYHKLVKTITNSDADPVHRLKRHESPGY